MSRNEYPICSTCGLTLVEREIVRGPSYHTKAPGQDSGNWWKPSSPAEQCSYCTQREKERWAVKTGRRRTAT